MSLTAPTAIAAAAELQHMHSQIDQAIADELRSVRAYSAHRGGGALLWESVSSFVLGGGKRVRPLLFLIAWRGYGQDDSPAIVKAAVSFELFHAFALMHDDLLDRSPLRRGRLSMHGMLEAGCNDRGSSGVGRDLALIAGDVTFAMAVDAFRHAPGSEQRKAEALHRMMLCALDTGHGVFDEVFLRERSCGEICRETMIALQERKTACYTFVCPLASAAILAGVEETELERLERFGLLLGRAYQIHDDISDLRAFLAAPPQTPPCRPCELKLQWPFFLAYREADAPQRRQLDTLVGAGLPDPGALATLERVLTQARVWECSRADRDQLRQEADRIFETLGLSDEGRNLARTCLAHFFAEPDAGDTA